MYFGSTDSSENLSNWMSTSDDVFGAKAPGPATILENDCNASFVSHTECRPLGPCRHHARQIGPQELREPARPAFPTVEAPPIADIHEKRNHPVDPRSADGGFWDVASMCWNLAKQRKHYAQLLLRQGGRCASSSVSASASPSRALATSNGQRRRST
jgi:hypothetical protein